MQLALVGSSNPSSLFSKQGGVLYCFQIVSLQCSFFFFYVLCRQIYIDQGISTVSERSGLAAFLCLFVYEQEKPVFSQWRRGFISQFKFFHRRRGDSPLCFSVYLPALAHYGVPTAFVSLVRCSLCSISLVLNEANSVSIAF